MSTMKFNKMQISDLRKLANNHEFSKLKDEPLPKEVVKNLDEILTLALKLKGISGSEVRKYFKTKYLVYENKLTPLQKVRDLHMKFLDEEQKGLGGLKILTDLLDINFKWAYEEIKKIDTRRYIDKNEIEVVFKIKKTLFQTWEPKFIKAKPIGNKNFYLYDEVEKLVKTHKEKLALIEKEKLEAKVKSLEKELKIKTKRPDKPEKVKSKFKQPKRRYGK